MLFALLNLFLLFLVILKLLKFLNLKFQLREIPGPTGFPILGNALALTKGGKAGLLRNITAFREKYGSRMQIWLGLQPYLVISNSNDMEKILSSQRHIEKGRDYRYLHAWLGQGLLTSGGSLWHSRRKLLTPAFHFTILEDFLPIISQQADILTDILAQKKGEEFNIFPYITRAALDIISETAMGKQINVQKNWESDYVKAVYRMSELVQYRAVRPWLVSSLAWSLSPSGREEARALKILHGFAEKVIQERKAERSQGIKQQTRKPAFLDLLLDYQQSKPDQLSDVAIREEVDTFMFEGHDTTTANMAWTIYLIGRHPEVQAKVHAELDDVLSEYRGEITSAALSKLKYLESCIKESLRLYPSVPFVSRCLDSDFKLDKKTVIPKDMEILLLFYHSHRDPEIFEDPEAFRPERLGQMEKISFNYVPFSAGPRNCIGQKFALMEEKVVLAKIFQKFKVTSLQTPQDINPLAELILRPQEGINVILESRE